MNIARFSLATIFLAIIIISSFCTEFLRELAVALEKFRLIELCFILGSFIALRLVQASSLRLSLQIAGIRISMGSSIELSALKGVFNLGFTGLGLAAQSVQGRLAHLLPVRVTIYANVLQSLCLVLALGLSLFSALLFLTDSKELSTYPVFLGLGTAISLVSILGIAAFISPGSIFRRVKDQGWIKNAFYVEGVDRSGLRKLPLILFFQFLLVAIRIIRFAAIAFIISPDVEMGFLIIAVLSADTLSVIPVTPGGIGVRELIIAIMGAIAAKYEIFLAAAIIDRVFMIAFNFIHGAIAIWASGRR